MFSLFSFIYICILFLFYEKKKDFKENTGYLFSVLFELLHKSNPTTNNSCEK